MLETRNIDSVTYLVGQTYSSVREEHVKTVHLETGNRQRHSHIVAVAPVDVEFG